MARKKGKRQKTTRRGAKRRKLLTLAAAVAVGLALACLLAWALSSMARRYDPGKGRGENFILIISDALRKDRLSCYGYARMSTPAIDLLAAEGVLFENVLAPSTWTKTSVSSTFTGLYPIKHRVMRIKDALPRGYLTMAEMFRLAGYDTAAAMANPWLSEEMGFAQGFVRYDYTEDPSRMPGEAIVDRAIEWLEKEELDSPFFLLLYFMDTHFPYQQSPRDLAERLGLAEQDIDWLTIDNQYDSGVAYLDAQLGRLWPVLKEKGLWQDSLIVFTSDHGEELFERGRNDHGHSLYSEVVDVPLIVHQPSRLPRGRRVERRIEGMDLLPTVLEALGLSRPRGLHAHSRYRLLRFGADDSPEEVCFSEVGLNDRISNIDFISAT